MYTIGSSKAGTTLAGVASEHKFAGWDGTTFKYETKKKTSSLLAAIFFFVSPVAQEALAKVMGVGVGEPLGKVIFSAEERQPTRSCISVLTEV